MTRPGDALIAMTPYAVEYRYPGETATAEEARAAAQSARQVRDLLRPRLGLKP